MPFADTFIVSPSFGVVGWVLVACFVAGCVTASKGRWGWLAIGLLTSGVLWLYSAFLVAKPESLWARAFHGRTPAER